MSAHLRSQKMALTMFAAAIQWRHCLGAAAAADESKRSNSRLRGYNERNYYGNEYSGVASQPQPPPPPPPPLSKGDNHSANELRKVPWEQTNPSNAEPRRRPDWKSRESSLSIDSEQQYSARRPDYFKKIDENDTVEKHRGGYRATPREGQRRQHVGKDDSTWRDASEARDASNSSFRIHSSKDDKQKQQNRRLPIHYEFPAVSTNTKQPTRRMTSIDTNETEQLWYDNADKEEKQEQEERDNEDEDYLPRTVVETMTAGVMKSRDLLHQFEDEYGMTASRSPRRDALAMYTSTKGGKLQVMIAALVFGAGFGAFVGKSLANAPSAFAIAGSFLFLLMSLLRGDYGEMSRSLGLAMIFAFQRTRRIRSTYRTMPHLKAILGASPRQAFPPHVSNGDDEYNGNPWTYKPIYEDDVDFRMTQSILSMAFVGAICGGNLPVVPTWIGAIGGASSLAFISTRKDAKGDLTRTMGMRVVSLTEEVFAINSELHVFGKARVVGGKILDKLLIVDRKHKIRDKLASTMQWIFGKVSNAANQVKNDMQAQTEIE